MRHPAMRLRGLLRSGTVERLDIWLNDARKYSNFKCSIYGMRRFARTLRQNIEAVRNAALETWSNGQTEGQINRLKTLKRATYRRAGVDSASCSDVAIERANFAPRVNQSHPSGNVTAGSDSRSSFSSPMLIFWRPPRPR